MMDKFPVLSSRVTSNDPVLRPTLNDIRMRLPQLIVLLCCIGLTVTFGHHSIYGRHGFEARRQLRERSSLLDFEIRSLEAVRSGLERDVALLTPELPNADLVEEIARDQLGFVAPGDRVLLDTGSQP
ncbi:MAG: septum formation initiator family protein [Hyphomicrobium sp.]